MHVVAFLPPSQLSHLGIVLGRRHTLHAADGWDVLESLVRREPVDVAVIDPVGTARSMVRETVELLHRFPSLPVMLYTSLAPSALKAVAELAPHGVRHVVIHRYEDQPSRFLELIERLPEHALGEAVLDRLATPLSKLPPTLATAVERLVRRPHLYGNVEALAAAAGVTVRTVYRHVESAGFSSPRSLLVGARLLRAYSYLRDPGHSVEDIAVKLGYTEPRIFTRNAREALGLTPTALRRALAPDAFLERLVAFVYPTPPAG